MPTVKVPRELLHQRLGIDSEEEVDKLCFDIGLELDDVTTEKAIIRKEKHLDAIAEEDEEVIYKIEVPANRYDLLSAGGIIRAFRVFRGLEQVPEYKVSRKSGSLQRITVKHETTLIRPFITAAIVRNIDERLYDILIDIQEKLHHTVCRNRSLVAIGIHDLDSVEGPFSYEALPPSDIKFVPLKQCQEYTGKQLMEFYKAHPKLKKFLHLIEDSPVFPVLFDSKRRVLSLPPIINGSHSAVNMKTRNLLIECTATDLTRSKAVLNTLVSTFYEYCGEVEAVEVMDQSGNVSTYPDLSPRAMDVDLSYIRNTIGVHLAAGQVVNLLDRMQLKSAVLAGEKLRVSIPVTRSDVLHPCDVAEDVAIAYGYNNIPKTKPRACTQGRQQPLNEISDQLRRELAMAGYTEVLNWVLLARKENSSMVKKEDNNKTAVVVANPRSVDFEVLRTSLLPGILKVMEHNKDFPRPLKIFEISDVVHLDPGAEVGARNVRHLAAMYSGAQKADLQIIHGLLDTVMSKLDILAGQDGYTLSNSQKPEFFGSHQTKVLFRNHDVGGFGVIHPQVLKNFGVGYPCCYLELELERLLSLQEELPL